MTARIKSFTSVVTLGLGKYQIHSLMLGSATLWNESVGIVPPFSNVPGGTGVGGSVTHERHRHRY